MRAASVPTISFVLLAIGLAGCGQGSGTNDAQPWSRSTPISLSAAPPYARALHETRNGSVWALASLVSNHVLTAKDSAPGAVNTLVPTGCPQSVVVLGGTAGVIVASVDFPTDTSWIELFTDATGDGVADSSTRSLICQLTGTHAVHALLASPSASMYVADPLAVRLYRIADTDANSIPDTCTTFASSGAPLPTDLEIYELVFVETHAVGLRTQSMLTDIWASKRVSDDNQDGTADAIADYRDPNEPDHWEIGGYPKAGDTAIDVFAPSVGCDLRVVDSVGAWVATLATFSGTSLVQTVVTSRALVAGERLQLRRTDTNAVLASRTTRAASEVRISEMTSPLYVAVENATVTLGGSGLSASDTVRCTLLSDTTHAWHACVVTASTGTTITFNVPELGLVEPGRTMFEVESTAGDKDSLICSIKPN